MAFIEFTPSTIPATHGKSVALVNINQKSGTFQLNHVAAELLGIKGGDCAKFMFDEAEPEDWYIVPAKDGFPFREKTSGKHMSYITNSSFTARKILDSHRIDKNSVSARIKTEPIKINKQVAYLLLIQKPTD
jgi:hypothetical protein